MTGICNLYVVNNLQIFKQIVLLPKLILMYAIVLQAIPVVANDATIQ